jgi:hypothetical protein
LLINYLKNNAPEQWDKLEKIQKTIEFRSPDATKELEEKKKELRESSKILKIPGVSDLGLLTLPKDEQERKKKEQEVGMVPKKEGPHGPTKP